jgi:hypothetical protein
MSPVERCPALFAGRRGKLLMWGAIIWPSFLMAGVASVLFFAAFDPQVLTAAATFPVHLTRGVGYTVGFLLFWLLTAAASGLTITLLFTAHSKRTDEGDTTR